MPKRSFDEQDCDQSVLGTTMKKKLIASCLALILIGVAGVATFLVILTSNLPQLITVEDYQPLLVSQVYDRNGEKIGEFFREKRILTPFEKIPKVMVQAIVSSEDDDFFEHGGINFIAFFRAFMANLKAGRKVQGGSTITMQAARTLLLSSEKTYIRKLKEIVLARRMEANLTKEDILYLYLNQIYFGHGAYGVAAAAQIYFRKPIEELTLPEAAMIAGLPQAPSRYSPIRNPSAAKARQKYVLKRMAAEGYITEEDAQKSIEQPLKVFVRQDYKKFAPYYLETVRQLLVKKLGEVNVLNKGLQIHTGLDLPKQLEAHQQMQKGLRQLDKRQGYRGPKNNITNPEEVARFLQKTRDQLIDEANPEKTIQPDGTITGKGKLNLSGQSTDGVELETLPKYVSIDQIVKGIVTAVDDKWGLVTVRFAESKGLIDFETMEWARKPNPQVRWDFDKIKKPSEALQRGDVIEVRIIARKFRSMRIKKELEVLRKKKRKNYERPEELPEFNKYVELELEQEPIAEASLVSLDQNNSDLISMIGGYSFERSQFNRAIQAARQTGSCFKPIVYAAALDKGYTPATPILDAPIVYEEEDKEVLEANDTSGESQQDHDSHTATKKWKPMNHSHKFAGDVLFRNALLRSLNVPTVKIIEKIGVEWAAEYAKRLGIFSPLNMDYTLALGSSGVTLYEMTKAFAQLGKLGRRIYPRIIRKVLNQKGETLLENVSLDERFESEIKILDEQFEQKRTDYLTHLTQSTNNSDESKTPPETQHKLKSTPPLFFQNPEQLLKPSTAYLISTLLQAAVEEPGGTGGRARSLGRPVAGKTGTTSGYYDAWFVGFSPDIATGVWVGFDKEKTLGRGEVGGRAALPIWLNYMKFAHKELPPRGFPTPDGIVFANIDNSTGKLASANSDNIVRQAFAEGTEPKELTDAPDENSERNFYKEDLSE